jgi:hypothetical protein
MHLGSYRGAGLENPGCLETQSEKIDWLLRVTRAERHFGMLLDEVNYQSVADDAISLFWA